MEITGAVTAGKLLSSALGLFGKGDQAQEATEGRRLETPSIPPGTVPQNSAIRAILAEYDVTDISPRAFSEMTRKLHDAGAVTDEQFQELLLIREDLDLEGVDLDESVNLVDFYLDKLRTLGRSADDFEETGGSVSAGQALSPLAPILRRLQWIEKLAAVQSGPERAGLDALG
ncbi:MAG: hypothetical protein A2V98_26055 [Planctomycetes bacterium RBG_16_64_12]|nr:MAG: hypothetical protein A2V98_26055 [Planctomycetes bacterium RBG_16_64_12]